MENQVKKEADITLRVGLDDANIPIKLSWKADDQPNMEGFQNVKAAIISLFEPETMDTLKISLWTKEMEVGEMDRFVFQSLKAMADTYQRATNNTKLANEVQKFAHYFGQETGIIRIEENS